MHAAAFGLAALVGSVGLTALGPATQTPAPAPRPATSLAAPCGFVTFVPTGAPRVTAGTMMERVRATVAFADGHTETATFPYLWVYPNGEQTDPWSYTNLKNDSGAVAMQLPPPGTDEKVLPPLIAYIVAHTDAAGMTTFVDCKPHKSGAPLASVGRIQPMPTAPELLRFVDESPPDSPVAILEATVSSIGAPEHRIPGVVQQCVTFENRAPKAVARVRIGFTYRADHDKLAVTHALSSVRPLAPGAVVRAIRRDPGSLADALSDASNCRVFGWRDDISTLTVSVTSVTFADGSTWTPHEKGLAPARR